MTGKPNTLRIVATITLLASLFIISVPSGNSQSNNYVDSIKLFISWTPTAGEIAIGSGSTMSGALIWDGSIDTNQGTLNLVRPLFDEDEDYLTSEVSPITFQSETMPEDTDGLYLSITNAATDSTITITFDNQPDITLPLRYFLSDKTYTYTKHGATVLITREDFTIDKGTITGQFDSWKRNIIRTCLEEGTDEATCIKLNEFALGKGYHALWSKKFRALKSLEKAVETGTGSTMVNADVLLFTPRSQLREFLLQHFDQLDLSTLSDINGRIEYFLDTTGGFRTNNLQEKLRDKFELLSGELPATIRETGQLQGDLYTKWSQVMSSLNDQQKVLLRSILGDVRPELFAKLNALSLRDLGIAARRLLSFTKETLAEHGTRYIDQLITVSTLRKQFEQVKGYLSNSDSIAIENALKTLETEYLYKSTLTPIIYKKLEDLFATVKAQSRDAVHQDVEGITKDVDAAITLSNSEKIALQLTDFNDVPESAWYNSYVREAKKLDIISGYKDKTGKTIGSFGPSNTLTVGELLKVALKLAEVGEKPIENKTHWAEGYLQSAKEIGITLAKNSNLDLNRPATRAEVTQSFLEAFGIYPPTIEDTDFTDVSPLPLYGKYIQYAKDLDIISGDDTTSNFRPHEPINRAEVAKVISNMYHYVRYPLEVSKVTGDLATE